MLNFVPSVSFNLVNPINSLANRKNKFSIVYTLKSEYKYNIFLDGENRAKRTITQRDRYAILKKPLGLILEEKEDGMVCIAKIDPAGNAAKSGFDIKIGDVVVAVSATFGDEVWSTRGIGLDRVLKSIKIRSGDYVTLVLENPEDNENFAIEANLNAEKRRIDAREKFGNPVILDPITLTPIKSDEINKQKKKFFGLF
ncbi:hypothetical protein (nucleomorph) [Guillardia theta]|uniref:PDZ domain-containing protein n=1 Tax=Guillardia theta TaxID=55529 RepID=Q98RX8_GUITH|nr:hypothetical protein GTHECHR1030 [Guillardia theta]AAK39822.1 hypothetical protein [Guillardia theta]